MGEVIRFPDEAGYARGGKYVDANTEPATVIILPVVRVVREPDGSNGLEPDFGQYAQAPPPPPSRALTATGLEPIMRHSPPPLTQALHWRRHALAVLAVALLGGCGTPNGDFGEVRPTLVRDDMHDWVGPYASADYASGFALTDDERALRDLGYPLIDPPYDLQQWYSVAGQYGLYRPARGRAFDRTAYANWLLSGDGPSPLARYSPKLEGVRHEVTTFLSSRERSPAVRYARLTDDVRNDITRLPEFFETATRVLDIDQKRRKSMDLVSELSPAERKNAGLRMRENAAIVALTREKLAQREASYRYALERLVVASPLAQAAEVERAINQLRATIARYHHLTPSWVREQNLATAR